MHETTRLEFKGNIIIASGEKISPSTFSNDSIQSVKLGERYKKYDHPAGKYPAIEVRDGQVHLIREGVNYDILELRKNHTPPLSSWL